MFPLPSRFAALEKTVDEDRIDWADWKKMVRGLLWESRGAWAPAYFFITLCALFSLASPVLVYEFISAIEKGGQNIWWTGTLGLGIGLTGLVSGLFVQHYFVRILGLYQILTNTLNRKLFLHSLRLKKSSRDELAVGDIVNHMSSDSDSLANMGSIIGDLIYNVVLITGFISLLFYYMGHAAWVGLVVLFALFPLTKRTGRLFSELDTKLMKKRDERVSLMSQILSSIRVVKYFVWEKSVSREVQKVRHEELRLRGELARAEMGSTMVYVAVGTMVLFTVLGAHILMGRALEAALVFVCVSLFRLVEDPFSMFSRIIAQLANARVAAQRVSGFLQAAERAEDRVQVLSGTEDVAVRLDRLSVEYGGLRALSEVSVDIRRGENFAIVGPVGSGKSSLLYALLGELDFSGEIAIVKGQRAFAPQEAYIINSTLRENLSFGRKDVAGGEWARVLHAACLEEDLQQMRSGLDTEIGERGVSLSGGQKQRISLARCALQNPEVIFLDDPLSAVDPKTEAALLDRLINGLWAGKTRITVTHRLEHMPLFDRILFMAGGEVKGLGTFRELMDLCPEFRGFMQDHARSEVSDFGEAPDLPAREPELPKDATGEAVPVLAEALVERVTEDEDRARGAVEGSVYFEYIKSLGGPDPIRRRWIWAVMLGTAVLATSLPLIQKTWLAWVTNAQAEESGGIPWFLQWMQPILMSPAWAVVIYGVLGLAILGGILLSDLYWLKRGLKAGRALHDDMLHAILRAQIRFFDSTPVGRVLQRFSRDLEAVDVELQWAFENSVKSLIQVLVNLVLIIAVLPPVALILVPIFWVYYRIQLIYRNTAREVKRLDSVHRSPRYAHFKETLQGLVVLRSFGREEWFMEEFADRLTRSQRMFYGHYLVNRWFSSRIPVVGSLVAMATTSLITVAVAQGHMTPGVAGLVTVSSLGFWGVLNWGIRIWADVESRMTSVERIKSFARLPAEGLAVAEPVPVRNSWPEKGEVEFAGVKLRYAAHLPLVLHGMDFKIEGGSRVGLIGRTGSGKSTIFQALYRFIECEEGQILIDGVDISRVELSRLRRTIAIIPQDPTLFLGTLRSNLDRFRRSTDAEIWTVLEKVKLANFVRSLPGQLESAVVENGANLSQGQRQLICLARALLVEAKIIVLDEATASVDVKTDSLVQEVIREACGGMTMIVIAHRLGTVKDCDQILELQAGRLKRRIFPRARLGVGGKQHDTEESTATGDRDTGLQRRDAAPTDARESAPADGNEQLPVES